MNEIFPATSGILTGLLEYAIVHPPYLVQPIAVNPLFFKAARPFLVQLKTSATAPSRAVVLAHQLIPPSSPKKEEEPRRKKDRYILYYYYILYILLSIFASVLRHLLAITGICRQLLAFAAVYRLMPAFAEKLQKNLDEPLKCPFQADCPPPLV
jgi:hypothetical protein